MRYCNLCGQPWHGHGTACNTPQPQEFGRYTFTPNQLTEADLRRIVREELERAKETK